MCSDHHPIWFVAGADEDREEVPRRVSKTFLRSDRLERTVNTLYEISLRAPLEELKDVLVDAAVEHMDNKTAHIQPLFHKAMEAIVAPMSKSI